MYGYIYKTTNLINGKIYIGKRKGCFTSKYLGSGRYLRNAIHKYGKENFEVIKIEDCETLELQNEREKYWIDFYFKSGVSMYNISRGGDGGDTFYKLNEIDRNKRIEKLSKNSYFANLSFEEQSALSKKAWVTRRKNENDKFSEEYRKKLSESHKGYKVSQETKEKISKTNTGRKLSEEHKKKISLSNMGKHTMTQEHRKRLSELGKLRVGEKNHFYGKHHTEETKNKLAEMNRLGICGMKGRHLTDEQKKHHSDAMIGKNANTKWMNDGVKTFKIKIDEVDEYLEKGYKLGRKVKNKKFVPWNKKEVIK